MGVAAHSMYRSDERSYCSRFGWLAIATAIGAAPKASVTCSRSMCESIVSRSNRGKSVMVAADTHVQPVMAIP